MSERKYHEGDIFKTVGELAEWLDQGNSVYIYGRFNHLGWVTSFQFRYLQNIIKSGVVTKAIPQEPAK